jgi:hypothetical protein
MLTIQNLDKCVNCTDGNFIIKSYYVNEGGLIYYISLRQLDNQREYTFRFDRDSNLIYIGELRYGWNIICGEHIDDIYEVLKTPQSLLTFLHRRILLTK